MQSRQLRYMFNSSEDTEIIKGDWFCDNRSKFCWEVCGRSGRIVYLISNMGEGTTISSPFNVVTPPVTPPFQGLTADSSPSL